MSRNCSDLIVALLGIFVARGSATGINVLATKEELERQVRDSGSVYILADRASFSKAADVTKRVPRQLRDVFIVNEAGPNSIHAIMSDVEADFPPLPPTDSRNSVLVLPYSSGTTGVPKGVVHTHHSSVAVLRYLKEHPQLPFAQDDVMLSLLPLCYLFAFDTVFASLIRGSKVIFLPKFDFKTLCHVIEKYKITYLPAVPALLETMVLKEIPADCDLSSLRYVMFSGDALHPETAKRFRSKYNVSHLLNDYGTTETGNVMIGLIDKDGKCQFNTFAASQQIKIVDIDTKEDVGPYQGGELLVKSPLMMKGYRNRPKETKETFAQDGFIRTGDIAYFDDHGSIHVVGRHKNMIKYKGHQVSPVELEAVLLQHEAILSAVVIGIPHANFGEVPRAYIVLKPEYQRSISAGEIQTFVAERTAFYKHLRGGVEFVEEFPKSSVGKILRRKLREDYEKRFLGHRNVQGITSPPPRSNL